MDYHRLRWASRRGMLELDLILTPFVEMVYPNLSDDEKVLFHQLLESEDQDLFNWFLNKEVPNESSLVEIVNLVLDHTGITVKT